MRNTLKIIILLMFICGMIFLFVGHIDYYNEQAVREIDGEYLGTAQLESSKDAVKFTLADGTEFTTNKDLVSGVDLEKISGMTVNLFADLAEIKAHEEKRTIVTGRLKSEDEATFYRIIRVKCVPLTESNISKTPSVDHALIRWQEDGIK